MALQKEIETNTGIITNYHRILSINSIINKEIQIIVYSYANQNKRKEESIQQEEEIFNVISSEMITKEYEENFDIVKAYDYLKSLKKFENAINC